MPAVITFAQAHALACLFMAADGVLDKPSDDRAKNALNGVASQLGFESWEQLFHYRGLPQAVEAVHAADYLVSPDQGDEVLNCEDAPLRAALEEFAQKVLAAREAHSTFSEEQVKQMVQGAFVEGMVQATASLQRQCGEKNVVEPSNPEAWREHHWKESEAKRQLELHLSEPQEQEEQPQPSDRPARKTRSEEDDCA